MITLLSKQNLDFMPCPNEYHLILDNALPPQALITAALGLIFDGDRFLMTRLNARGWDIPGGHIEPGESPRTAVIREIYEETAVHVRDLQLFAYEKFVVHGSIPEGYQYPCPVSYQVFYLGHVATFDPFTPTSETQARKLFTPEETRQTEWGNRGSVLYEAALVAVTAPTKNELNTLSNRFDAA